jgi:hypothetical protein
LGTKILRYPIKPPVPENRGGDDVESPTEFIDYLCLRRYQINYSDSDSKYFGLNLPGNNVKKNYGNDTRVYLSIPNQIQTNYRPQYNQVDLGVAGLAAAELIAGGGSGLDNIVDTAQAFARGSRPEFAASAIAGAANNLGQMLGLAGNLDANSLQALTKGKVFNPFQEQIFKNMAFRTHNFNFKLFARSAQEAREIYDIIQWIKTGSVPRIGGGSKTIDRRGLEDNEGRGFLDRIEETRTFKDASSSRFFEVPDKFELKYKRFSPTTESIYSGNELHHKIKDSVCAGIQVNYTPDGSYNAFRQIVNGETDSISQIHVPSVALGLTFIETSIISEKDIREGY